MKFFIYNNTVCLANTSYKNKKWTISGPFFAHTDLLCGCIALSMNQHNIRRVDILRMYIGFQVGAKTDSPSPATQFLSVAM